LFFGLVLGLGLGLETRTKEKKGGKGTGTMIARRPIGGTLVGCRFPCSLRLILLFLVLGILLGSVPRLCCALEPLLVSQIWFGFFESRHLLLHEDVVARCLLCARLFLGGGFTLFLLVDGRSSCHCRLSLV